MREREKIEWKFHFCEKKRDLTDGSLSRPTPNRHVFERTADADVSRPCLIPPWTPEWTWGLWRYAAAVPSESSRRILSVVDVHGVRLMFMRTPCLGRLICILLQ